MEQDADFIKLEEERERQEALEHRDVLLAIAEILQRPSGETLFAYLFENFEVMSLPPQGLEGNELHDYLGFLRAGNAIFKLASEADYNKASSLLAKLERKRYERLKQQYADGQ